MNDKSLQKSANITVVLSAIYNMQNRADIPRAKLRELEPCKKELEAELWSLLTGTEKKVDDKETTNLIANKIAEAKAQMAEEKKSKKADK